MHLSLKTQRLQKENELIFEFSHRSLIVDGKPNITKKAILAVNITNANTPKRVMHQQENLKYDHKIINKYHTHKKQNKHCAFLKRTWRFPNNCKCVAYLNVPRQRMRERCMMRSFIYFSGEMGNFLPFISLYIISRAPLWKAARVNY